MTEAAPAEKKATFERQAKWREKHPLKRWAHVATASALRRGLLERQRCEIEGCGEENTDAHHDDYTRPMSVRWLCRKHHKAEHVRLKLQCEEAA
jgi:hypothetical protein